MLAAFRSALRRVWAGGKDLWHLRSLLFTEPVDFMIGSSCGKITSKATPAPR